jgi:hypothetical protein
MGTQNESTDNTGKQLKVLQTISTYTGVLDSTMRVKKTTQTILRQNAGHTNLITAARNVVREAVMKRNAINCYLGGRYVG